MCARLLPGMDTRAPRSLIALLSGGPQLVPVAARVPADAEAAHPRLPSAEPTVPAGIEIPTAATGPVWSSERTP